MSRCPCDDCIIPRTVTQSAQIGNIPAVEQQNATCMDYGIMNVGANIGAACSGVASSGKFLYKKCNSNGGPFTPLEAENANYQMPATPLSNPTNPGNYGHNCIQILGIKASDGTLWDFVLIQNDHPFNEFNNGNNAPACLDETCGNEVVGLEICYWEQDQ